MSSNSQPSITTIEDLPDECLRHLFLHVPMSTTPGKSWISLRAVCKRWSSIIDDCWREFKTLTLYDGASRLALHHSQKDLLVMTSNESVRRKTADQFIERCGPYLKILNEFRIHPSTQSIMSLVANKCLNLEDFCGLVRSKSDGQQLRVLLDACDKLNFLTISIEGGKIYNFFQRIPTHRLLFLTLRVNIVFDRHLLKYVKSTIRHCHVLKRLQIDYMDAELLGLLTTLSELYLGRPDRARLDPYRTLTLINDELLLSMSNTCQQLASLLLKEWISITDDGIFALSSLPKLKELHLMNLPKVTGKYLKNFPELDTIILRGCPAGDAEVVEILKNCQVLRLLDVGGSNITNKSLAAAVQLTKNRTNNITLKIRCDQTETNPGRFQGASPLLEFVQLNPRV